MEEIKLKQVAQIKGSYESTGRIYSDKGLSPTLNTCGGGNLEPKIMENCPIAFDEQNNYLRKEIDKNYETLKITVSELDANIRLAVENAPYKTIVTSNSAYKFLEKYGVKVYLVNDDTSSKDLSEIDTLIKQGKITKIFNYEEDKTTANVQNIINK